MASIAATARLLGAALGGMLLHGCGMSLLDGLGNGEELSDGGDDATAADVHVVDAKTDARVLDASESGAFDVASDVATRDVATVDADAARPGCTCPGNGYCNGSDCVYPSCIARLLSAPKTPSGVYAVDPDGPEGAAPFQAFCEMVLDGGGWTLLLKVDGSKTTFAHDANLWENESTFQPDSPALDTTEAKLAGYSTMPFVYLRIGMLDSGAVHWLILPLAGQSLEDLMSSGFHATNVGRAAWERLPARGSLQSNCNREGINVSTPEAVARIGIVANNQSDCNTCNSWIAFGADGQTTGPHACGNVAATSPDNGDRDTTTFGYVMVR